MSKLSDNIEKARTASRNRIDGVKEKAGDSAGIALEKMSESKQRAAALLGDGKAKAAEGVAATRDIAKSAASKSEETITKNPLAVIAGGLALGALVGALLPKSNAESKYVGGAGKRINQTARKAYDAAKDAGQQQIETLGLSKNSIQEQIKDLLGKVIEAVKSAAETAGDTVTSDRTDK
ncbi:hypothetical protein AB1K62_02895 [Parasphingorhabdus sp. JC815]|uniref:DUF883 family protein n=1 Tax=Parasphingorhabdus sp. JC815 TaxID=3232140 RepID=UPI0034583E9D